MPVSTSNSFAVLARLLDSFKTRGLSHTAGFLLSRILRIQRHEVFSHELLEIPEAPLPVGAQALVLSADFALPEYVRHKILQLSADNHQYLEEVRSGNSIGVALLIDDELAHLAFMMLRTRTLCLLGLPDDAALLGHAYTLPQFRRRGLQSASVSLRLNLARQHGVKRVYSETSPDNLYSQRGIMRGGMAHLGRMNVMILMNCLVLRWGRGYPARAIEICR